MLEKREFYFNFPLKYFIRSSNFFKRKSLIIQHNCCSRATIKQFYSESCDFTCVSVRIFCFLISENISSRKVLKSKIISHRAFPLHIYRQLNGLKWISFYEKPKHFYVVRIFCDKYGRLYSSALWLVFNNIL